MKFITCTWSFKSLNSIRNDASGVVGTRPVLTSSDCTQPSFETRYGSINSKIGLCNKSNDHLNVQGDDDGVDVVLLSVHSNGLKPSAIGIFCCTPFMRYIENRKLQLEFDEIEVFAVWTECCNSSLDQLLSSCSEENNSFDSKSFYISSRRMNQSKRKLFWWQFGWTSIA